MEVQKRYASEAGVLAGARGARWRRLWEIAFLVIMVPTLAACQERAGVPLGVVGYNHRDAKIYHFLINGGNGDSSLGAHSGGGSTSCCVIVPDSWYPGLDAEISWTNDLKNYHKQVVPIPAYNDKAGHLAVHFLRDGSIRVYVTGIYLGHPDYPLTGPEAGLNEGEDPVRKDLLDARARGKL